MWQHLGEVHPRWVASAHIQVIVKSCAGFQHGNEKKRYAPGTDLPGAPVKPKPLAIPLKLGSQAAGGSESLVKFARGGGRPIAAFLLQNPWQQEWKSVKTLDYEALSALIWLTRDELPFDGRLYKAFLRNEQALGSKSSAALACDFTCRSCLQSGFIGCSCPPFL